MSEKGQTGSSIETFWKILIRLVLWGIGLYFLYRIRSIVILIVVAAALTYATLPLVEILTRRRIRIISLKVQRLIAALMVFSILIVLTVTVVSEFAKPFQNELEQLGQNSGAYIEQLTDLASGALNWYNALPEDAKKFLQQQDFKGIADAVTTWTAKISHATFSIVHHLLEIILIPVLAFYFALDSRTLKREFLAIVPRRRRKEAFAIVHEINSIMRSYVVGQIILCVIAGIIVGIMLHLFNMPYVLILSVFAGITRAIPVIGPVVSGLVIVLLGVIKAPIIGVNLLVLLSALHFTESKFIMPKLIGDRMQLHPAIIIIVLLVGAEFFGIFGMFMAAPAAALVRLLVRHYLIRPESKHASRGLYRKKNRNEIHDTEICVDDLDTVSEK